MSKYKKIWKEIKKDHPENAFVNFMEVKDKFILDENKNVIHANTIEWGEFFENIENRIVKQEKINGYMISTVFIGVDHNFLWGDNKNHKLHIFETMVFKDENFYDIYCERYSTWAEAEEGHKKAIQWVKDGCKEDE